MLYDNCKKNRKSKRRQNECIILLFDSQKFNLKLKKELKKKIKKYLKNIKNDTGYITFNELKIPTHDYKGFLIKFGKNKQIHIFNKVMVYQNEKITEVFIDYNYELESKLIIETLKIYGKKLGRYKTSKLELELLRIRYH